MNKYVKNGVDSAKTAGLVLGGFIGGNAVSQVVKKSGWKFNLAMLVVALLAHGAVKPSWAKNLILGSGVYFGTKTLNDLTANVVNGLEGVPQGVKDVLNKYVPKLSGVDGDFEVELSGAEQQLLAQYAATAGRSFPQAPAPQAARTNLIGTATGGLI